MAQLNLSAAAKFAGVSRVTLYRDLKKGKLSVTHDVTGMKQFDTSELLRVYGESNSNMLHSVTVSSLHGETPFVTPNVTHDTVLLQSLQSENARLKALLEEKEARILDKERHIEDMRNTMRLLEHDRKPWWRFW